MLSVCNFQHKQNVFFVGDCGPTELTSASGTITPPLNAGNTGFLFGRECVWKIQVLRVAFEGYMSGHGFPLCSARIQF